MTHRIRATLTVLATMAAIAAPARADKPVAAQKPDSPKPQLSAKDAEHWTKTLEELSQFQ